jgi:hypothetical protein
MENFWYGLAVVLAIGLLMNHWQAILSLAALCVFAALIGNFGLSGALLIVGLVFAALVYDDQRGTGASTSPTRTGISHVYIVNDGFCYKVGVSDDPLNRVASLQTGHPNNLILVRTFELPTREAAFAVESDAHLSLERFRTRGEWFSASLSTVENAVERSAKMRGWMPTENNTAPVVQDVGVGLIQKAKNDFWAGYHGQKR